MNILERLIQDIEHYGLKTMEKKIGLSYSFLYGLSRDGIPWRVQASVLEEIYAYYKLPKDDFFKKNQKKWEAPTQSILWSLFRAKRVEKCLSVESVAKIVRGDARAIHRIESWDTLPNFHSYYITKFLEIYEFTDEEKQVISWFIVILRDLVDIYKKQENDIEKKVKECTTK